jgi:SAM-dependent methyltransferase
MLAAEVSETKPGSIRPIMAARARYFPITLHIITPADSALQRLLRQQIDEPFEEGRIKANLKSFGKIAAETSQKVPAQYEEHPYPRWTSFGRTPDDTDDMVLDNIDRLKPLKILVAGCATGHFPMRVAINYPYASVTGIDISLASLAYGVRKAKELDIRNIEFLHGDILDVGQLKRRFDMIFSLGVLHHMGDPERGWRCLVEVLNQGGLMKIGLYPEL